MRIARYSRDGRVTFGVVEDGVETAGEPSSGPWVTEIAGHPFGPVERTDRRVPLSEVRLLAPVLPSKVVAIGRNYAAHVAEMGNEVPAVPITFLKPSTAVIGPGEPIRYPGFSSEVHHEAELAVVISRLCRDVPASRAHEVILGYTCANDVSARDAQRAEQQWGRAKGFDTSCPLGPWVETEIDPSDLRITCSVNGELRQDGSTTQMITTVAELVVHVSAAMTLLPGDVLLTGTPAGVGPIQVGDEVEVTVSGIGTLRNPVTTW